MKNYIKPEINTNDYRTNNYCLDDLVTLNYGSIAQENHDIGEENY